uniref:Uncharacterized protein n=1 Tax=Peronospora matthiolae TaxID=2874970 RepID=A0AAV1T4M5_9STRA
MTQFPLPVYAGRGHPWKSEQQVRSRPRISSSKKNVGTTSHRQLQQEMYCMEKDRRSPITPKVTNEAMPAVNIRRW